MRKKYLETAISPPLLEYCKRQVHKKDATTSDEDVLKTGDNSLIGTLGEHIFRYHVPDVVFKDRKDFDFEHENGTLIEVKSHKVKRMPHDWHHFLLPDYKIDYVNDDAVIVIVEILEDYSKGWLCGWITKREFAEIAKHRKKGQKQGPNFTYRNDCLEIQYKDLKGFDLDAK